MACTLVIPHLSIQLDKYTLNDDFYVIELANTNVVLGLKWLFPIGRFVMNYQEMEMDSETQMATR